MNGVGHLREVRKVVDVLKVHVMEVRTPAILINSRFTKSHAGRAAESPVAEMRNGLGTNVSLGSDEVHGLRRGGGPDAVSETDLSDLKRLKKMGIRTDHGILL